MVEFSHTVWMLLKFDSLYLSYVPRDTYIVIIRLVVRPVGHAGQSNSYGNSKKKRDDS